MESGSGCGDGLLGRGFKVSFLILVRGTKDSFPELESFKPSNSLNLSFCSPGELNDIGLHLVEGRMLSL